VTTFIEGLLLLRLTRHCRRLSQKTFRVWRSRMDRWLCPVSFGCRRRRCSRDLHKMLILLFTVLLSWPNLFLASQLNPLHWCIAWNVVTLILRYATFDRLLFS